MTINVDAKGNNFVFDYYFNNCINQGGFSLIKSSDEDTWYSFRIDNKTIELSVSGNESIGSRSAYLIPHIEGKGDCSSSIIYIYQQSSKVCTCADLVVDLYAIPQSGISDNDIIGTYSVECEDNLLNGEIKYNGTLTNNVTFSNGYIHIVGTIDANISDSFKEFTFDIKYKNQLCSTYDLSQEGLNVKCDCHSIEYYINRIHTQFSLDGSGNKILIASADTHGCGSLSAKTFSDTIFENDEISYQTSPNGHYYYWYATVSAVTEDKVSTINVYYKNRDESSFDVNCWTAITVECKSSYIFYTCDLITGKQNLLYTNGYYDDSYCIYVDNWTVNKRFYPDYGQTVKFVPRLVDDVTESYLSTAKRTYASVPLNSIGVQLNTITVNKSTTSVSGTYYLADHSLPLVSIGDSNAAKKVYFAVDVYVNDMFCFTREGMYVANRSETSLTKCDVIRSYLYKMNSGHTRDYSEKNYYEDWYGDGYNSEKCNVYYNTCGTSMYCFKATPSAFTYNQNGSDVLGNNNWQEIPFDCIFGNKTYAEMLQYTIADYQCMQGSGLSFDGTLKPQIKLSQLASGPIHYEFEVGDDGYYTNRVRLTSGDTSSSYTKDGIYFGNTSGQNNRLHFGDDEGVFDCDNIEISLGVWLRANKVESYEDNLDYSSCSTLLADLTVQSGGSSYYSDGGGINLRTTTAQNAWQAGGYIRTLRFDYTMPHEKVKIENDSDGSIISLNLYWDDIALNASIYSDYNNAYKTIFATYNYNTSIVSDAVDALNLCGECESKRFNIVLPTSAIVTSFTVDTADGSLTCSASIVPTIDSHSSMSYECSKLRFCTDQQVSFNITTSQTYSFPSIVSQGQDIGTFTGLTDTQNYKIVASYDSNTPISNFTFNYSSGVIHMVLDSNYHASPTETTQSISVIFIKQMKNCDGEWVSCQSSDTILITLTDIPT